MSAGHALYGNVCESKREINDQCERLLGPRAQVDLAMRRAMRQELLKAIDTLRTKATHMSSSLYLKLVERIARKAEKV